MVVVTSCGRTGTNMMVEILRGHHKYKASNPPEDKMFYRDKVNKDEGLGEHEYLTKTDTLYFTGEDFRVCMSMFPNLKVVWTARHPYDTVLSKVYRGRPRSDNHFVRADDAHVAGCIADMYHMNAIFQNHYEQFKDRIIVAKMEDIILKPDETIQGICDFLGIEYIKSMKKFYQRMRHKGKKKRYSGIDKSQVQMWNGWGNLYSGYFKTIGYPIDTLFQMVDQIKETFDY